MQDEELELGLVRKDPTLAQSSIVDKGKSPKGETSPGSENMEGGWGASQSGGSFAKLIWDKTSPLNLILSEQLWEQIQNRSRTCFITSSGKIGKHVCRFICSTTLEASELVPSRPYYI